LYTYYCSGVVAGGAGAQGHPQSLDLSNTVDKISKLHVEASTFLTTLMKLFVLVI